MKKGLIVCLICFSIVVLSLSFASASWLGDFWNKITGDVVSSTQCSDGTPIGKIQIGTGSARWMCTDYNGMPENLDCYGGDNPPNTYLNLERHGWKCGRWGWECGGTAFNSGYCCNGVNQQEKCAEKTEEITFILEEGKTVTKKINGIEHSFKIISLSNYFSPTVVLEVNGRRLFPLSEGYIYTTDSKLNIFVKDINQAQISGQVNEVELIVSNKPMCFDSDNGKNYYQTGNVASNFSFGTGIISMDFCKDINVLQEGFCLNEKPRFENYDCSKENKICKNSACVEQSCGDGDCNGDETCETCSRDCGICLFCNDSDVTKEYPDGKNYYLRGEVNSLDEWGKVGFASDNCSSNEIVEFFCQRNDIIHKFYACPYGCVDGACLKLEEVSCDYAIENDFEKTSFTCENNKITSYYEKENLFAKGCIEECEDGCVGGIEHCIKKEQEPFFPIGIYVYGDTLDFELDDIKNLNFNTLIGSPPFEDSINEEAGYEGNFNDLFERAEQRGLRVITTGNTNYYVAGITNNFGRQDPEQIKEAIIDDINAFYGAKSFYKIYLTDEPVGNEKEKWEDYILANDFIKEKGIKNLFITAYYGGSLQKYWNGPSFNNYEEFIDSTSPNEIFVDVYPYRKGTDTSVQIDNMVGNVFAQLRETSIEKDIPWWYIGQVFSGGDFREPTPAEINLEVYLALVYGAKGIFYFDYATQNPAEHLGLISQGRGYFADKLAKATFLEEYKVQPKYDAVQQLNDELKVLGPILLNLKSTGVWNSREGISSSIIQGVSGNFEVGVFENGNEEYIMFVNSDTKNSQIAEIKLNPDYVELEDMYSKDRFQEDKNLEKPLKLFEINFEPGGGRLLRLDKNITFFGRFVNVLKRAFNLK